MTYFKILRNTSFGFVEMLVGSREKLPEEDFDVLSEKCRVTINNRTNHSDSE